MATTQMNRLLQHLRQVVLLRDGAQRTDGQLLEDYLDHQDAVALAALVQRHAPMVWGVCRRALANYYDAEDAFQATFLVLVRKAASIVPRGMVANWLYGVAQQTALKARATAARRRGREKQVAEMPDPGVVEQEFWGDLQALLDEALSRLPDKYRVVLVLCDLEGKARKEAARELGWPEGTVAGRLARARALLAKRLARHGPTVAGGALAAALSQGASAPAAVVSSTIQAASLLAAGPAVSSGLISAKVIALSEGVLKTMLVTKIKSAMAVVLVIGLVCGVAGTGLRHGPLAAQPAGPEAAAASPQGQEGPPPAPPGRALDGGLAFQQGPDTGTEQARYRALEKRVEELSKEVERLRHELHQRDEVKRPGNLEGPSPKHDSRFPDGRDWDFGTVRRGTLVKHSFRLVNTSDAALRLGVLRSSCGCLTGSANKEVLGPHEEGVVKIAVDTRKFLGRKTMASFLTLMQGAPTEEVRFSITGTSEEGEPDQDRAVQGSTPLLGPPVFVLNHRRFKMPFQVDQTRVKKVTLLSSTDGGRTWERGETVSPDRKDFVVVVPEDGEYLFAVETEDTLGRCTRGEPACKLIIDTKGNKD
jgi:RNA polymerase sigma factor (sigma-70 family)